MDPHEAQANLCEDLITGRARKVQKQYSGLLTHQPTDYSRGGIALRGYTDRSSSSVSSTTSVS